MDLPQPTRDLDRAEDDLFANGYCIVADVLSPSEVAALRNRLETQARAERERGVAYEYSEHVREAGTESFIKQSKPGEIGPKHQYVVTDDIADVAALDDEIPLTCDQDNEFYLRQEGKGLLLGCYEREGVHWSVDGTPADFGMELLPDDIDRIAVNMEAAIGIVPCFGSAGIKRVVNGPMMWSPDGAALVGPIPGMTSHFVATGMIPGFSQSAGVGWALADWILEGVPPVDMMPLDVTRFGDWARKAYVLARSAETYGKRFAIAYPDEEREAGRSRHRRSTIC